MEYTIERSQNHANWIIRQQQSSRQYDSYSFPSAKHWLGTDKYGMDMLTRLMYGGRVSLMIGFIVIIIETVIGVIFGGISGYFGGWVDILLMRVTEIFGLNGVGKLYIASLNDKDFEVVLLLQMFYVIISLLGNLVIDIAYGIADPRVRVNK